jgi:hypothetical protein
LMARLTMARYFSNEKKKELSNANFSRKLKLKKTILYKV